MNDNKAEALPLALYINGNNNSNQSSNNKGNRDISSNDRGQFVELLRNMKPFHLRLNSWAAATGKREPGRNYFSDIRATSLSQGVAR